MATWDEKYGKQIQARNDSLKAPPRGVDLRQKKVPKLAASTARSQNKAQKALQPGRGVKIYKAASNTLIEAEGSASGPGDGITDAEFKTMLLTALADGDVQDAILDIILAYFPAVTVDACGIGPRDYLTLP